MVKIFPSQYKDQPAVTIESETICAQFLPGMGAKMASLVYKPLQYELLVQRPGEKYRVQPFDGDYVAGECSGFDDMFPTIDKCFYESYPWQGTPLADHGEVWSLPWEQGSLGDRLHFKVHGVRFPYLLEKWISFTSDDILRLDYRVTNLSDFDFDFMWAAHTMLYLEEGARLLLPESIQSIISTLSFSGQLGNYGDEFPWPRFTAANGVERDLRQLQPKTVKNAEKYFIKGKMPQGYCGLTFPRSNFSLFLSFPVEKVPYLGILPNEGGWQDLYNVFLEPATATLDRLDVARLHKEYSTVKAKSTYDWHLNLSLANGTHFKQASVAGQLS